MNKIWAFDDAHLGLEGEVFVHSAGQIIDHMVSTLTKPEDGFLLRFADRSFPGAEHCLDWVRSSGGGTVYKHRGTGIEGWLCGVLFLFFSTAPNHIYVQVQNLPQTLEKGTPNVHRQWYLHWEIPHGEKGEMGV
jgi:hypothetical protein